MKFGSKDIPFVYKGDKLVYPNPIKDGLLLWYDFRGMRNTDATKEVAKDLSGNGNHGTLQNFNYSTSDFNLPELYKNTKLIVKDPSDPIYSDYPNPPVGAVFNNYNPVSNKIVRGNIDMPALVNTLVANMKLYHLYNDSVFLENAEIIGNYISSLVRNFSFYGADTWVVPNRVSLIDGEWTPLYGEINTRSLLQAVYALSEVLKVTGLYGSEVYQLTQTIGLMHNNIKSRVTGGELRVAMNGAVYEYIYANEDTNALGFSWTEFGISSSDMIAKAMNSYIESMGEDVIYDSQGTEFTPQQILDGAAEHIKAVYDSGALTMEPTGLPYSFLRADSESETGMNWDWVDTQERGDTWFTNDTTLWIIEGISRLSQLTGIEGLYNIAKTYRDNFLALRELNHDSYDDKGDTRVIFYDRYNFDGSHLSDDVSISISGTALLWEVDEVLGIKDGALHSQMRDTLEAHIITDKNSDINGAFGWDANDATSFIEMKATGEIYSSPFIQADSSVSSGYKDNTLVFDGVDDSLTIPELVLDETAMTVVQDGKIYSYEDDKVMTVGEDGEIVSSGKNLLPSFYDGAWFKRQSVFAISPYHLRSAKGVRQAIIATIVLDVKPNTDYTIFVNSDLGRTRISGDSGSIMGYQSGDFSRVFNTSTNESVEVELGVFSGYVGEEINFSNVLLCQGRLTQLSFTPAPKDYKTTTLSPASLTDLQLYNKTLRKDELLHNAESKGLKQLKPGVVVQDGLVLHYDFSHESNTSEYKDKAFDYSGNGNHGVLNNFNFTEESGYGGNKLLFDGVDDYISFNNPIPSQTPETQSWSVELIFSVRGDNAIFSILSGWNLGIQVRPYSPSQLRLLNYTHTSGHLYSNVVMQKDEAIHAVFSYDCNTMENKITVNGEREFNKIQREFEIPTGISNEIFLSNKAQSKILSLKIYNRPLTAEEIAHNYAIDKQKFNII